MNKQQARLWYSLGGASNHTLSFEETWLPVSSAFPELNPFAGIDRTVNPVKLAGAGGTKSMAAIMEDARRLYVGLPKAEPDPEVAEVPEEENVPETEAVKVCGGVPQWRSAFAVYACSKCNVHVSNWRLASGEYRCKAPV